MRITTRARDERSNEVAIWMGAAGPVKTFDFTDSHLTPAQRHAEAATRWHILQTGRVPELDSRQAGHDYQRETWVHEATDPTPS